MNISMTIKQIEGKIQGLIIKNSNMIESVSCMTINVDPNDTNRRIYWIKPCVHQNEDTLKHVDNIGFEF